MKNMPNFLWCSRYYTIAKIDGTLYLTRLKTIRDVCEISDSIVILILKTCYLLQASLCYLLLFLKTN